MTAELISYQSLLFLILIPVCVIVIWKHNIWSISTDKYMPSDSRHAINNSQDS